MTKPPQTLKELIDGDEGLKSKRNALLWVSLVLLAVTFTGAVIKEANTFILKIEFAQGKAVGILLVLAIIFLGIRYYSFAQKYHSELTKLWKSDFFKDNIILYSDYETREPYGLLAKVAPEGFKSDYPNLGHEQMPTDWNWYYESKWFFRRYFVYEKVNKQHVEVEKETWVNLFTFSLKDYFVVLGVELKHQSLGYFKYPENLDIQAPYAIALSAILSLVFQNELSEILRWILT